MRDTRTLVQHQELWREENGKLVLVEKLPWWFGQDMSGWPSELVMAAAEQYAIMAIAARRSA